MKTHNIVKLRRRRKIKPRRYFNGKYYWGDLVMNGRYTAYLGIKLYTYSITFFMFMK